MRIYAKTFKECKLITKDNQVFDTYCNDVIINRDNNAEVSKVTFNIEVFDDDNDLLSKMKDTFSLEMIYECKDDETCEYFEKKQIIDNLKLVNVKENYTDGFLNVVLVCNRKPHNTIPKNNYKSLWVFDSKYNSANDFIGLFGKVSKTIVKTPNKTIVKTTDGNESTIISKDSLSSDSFKGQRFNEYKNFACDKSVDELIKQFYLNK